MNTNLLKQSQTLRHMGVTGQDDYGNDVYGVVSTGTVLGYLEQTEAREITLDRETYISDWLDVLPAGTTVDANDEIVYGGVTYEVIGPPDHVWDPRLGAEDHIECRLRVTSG